MILNEPKTGRPPNDLASDSVLGRLIKALGKTESGSCTLSAGAKMVGVSQDILDDQLRKFENFHRFTYNPDMGLIWRN